MMENKIWFFIAMFAFVGIGLLALHLFVKYTGHKPPSYSERLFENAFHALQELEEYYDTFPEPQRNKALTVLKGMFVELGALDRKEKK